MSDRKWWSSGLLGLGVAIQTDTESRGNSSGGMSGGRRDRDAVRREGRGWLVDWKERGGERESRRVVV